LGQPGKPGDPFRDFGAPAAKSLDFCNGKTTALGTCIPSFIRMREYERQSFCSDLWVLGGGKSTLLIELGQRGYATAEEPGRRIVKEELLGDGLALPWVNKIAFARRAMMSSRAGWIR
jgi:hypothetical protein